LFAGWVCLTFALFAHSQIGPGNVPPGIMVNTNTTDAPELLNTSHSAVELRALWRGKYPELFNSGASYFPDISGFLTSYVAVDHEIQAGRPLGVLPEGIGKINKTIDDYIANHPGRSLPPELSAIKSRINFDAYSDSALNSLMKRIQQLKSISTANPVQNYNIDQLCLVLMQEPYFTKKDQLTKVKNDFHAWMQQNEEQSAATLTKLAALNKDLRLSLDALNQNSFTEMAPQVKEQIDGIRDFIATNGIKNDSLKPASTLLSEFARLSASYLRSEYKYGQTTAENQSTSLGQTNHASKGDNSVVGVVIGSTALIMLFILLSSLILHAKGKIVFFADYTDATLTFLGPIAIGIFTILSAILSAPFTNSDRPLGVWVAFLISVGMVAFFGFRNSYINNRNLTLAWLAFISKYILSATVLLFLYSICSASSRRADGESDAAFERRRNAEARMSLVAAGIFTVIATFFIRYLVKNKRFSDLREYFSTSWNRPAAFDYGPGNPSESSRDDPRQARSEAGSENGADYSFPGSDQSDVFEAFKTLELSEEATWDQIKRAYHDLAQVWHPDRFAHNDRLKLQAQEKMKEINVAYEQLRIHFHKEKATA
jgi:hypothetical protein